MTILRAVNDDKGKPLMTAEQQRIADLEAQIARLKAQSQAKLRLKVSDKGALSVYGLGRFPVTLYRGQWERLAEAMPQIMQFIADNSDALSVKE